MADDLQRSLERTREGYDEELAWHKLLADAYTGGGGFSGAAKPPGFEFWGSSEKLYPKSESYLDQYPREEKEKFKRRIEAAHYTNIIAPLTDLKTSYILRKSFTFQNQPQQVSDWRSNIDGRGKPYDEMRAMQVMRAAVLGYVPALVDLPQRPEEAFNATVGQLREMGLSQPRVVPMFPANLVDSSTDRSGAFAWAKIRTTHLLNPDPLEEPVKVTRYTIWWPEEFAVYEIVGQEDPKKVDEGAHPFGEVPIAILRQKPALDDPILGLAMHGAESVAARTLFNLTSEQREHLRSQVFAILVLAQKQKIEGGSMTVGTLNAINIDPDSKQSHGYLAPPASCAETYEKRIDAMIKEIYRMARVEFTRPTGQSVSGAARRFEFAQTNRALNDFANQIASWDQHVDRLLASALGVSEQQREEARVIAPQDYDVSDIDAELDRAEKAVGLELGADAEVLIKLRVIDQVIQNLPREQRDKIEAQIRELADNAQLNVTQTGAEQAPTDGQAPPGGPLDTGGGADKITKAA